MGIILNKTELSTNELRRSALEILEAGLEAVDTGKILKKKVYVEGGMFCVENYDNHKTCMFELGGGGKIIFIGIGKCALDGARTIEEILGDYLTGGAVLDIKPISEAGGLKKLRYFEGTHPYPSEQNIEATKEILKMVENLTEKDLVITLISGGGSALFELPTAPLEELIEKTKELTVRGADIYELNNYRKSVSQVKGGRFAEKCFPAKVVSLIFSDVLGNDISVIASGPTFLPSPSQGEGQFAEGERGGVVNILIVSNHDALLAMKNKAEELGFNANIETEKLSGNAAEVGRELAMRDHRPKACILFGGETTVRIKELPAFAPESGLRRGEGGRNQELALSALTNIAEGTLLLSAASDGRDNTDHAGAIADRELLQKSKNLNLKPQEFLERSDSYNFFKSCGGAIYTGKLGSNVSDLCIILYK